MVGGGEGLCGMIRQLQGRGLKLGHIGGTSAFSTPTNPLEENSPN